MFLLQCNNSGKENGIVKLWSRKSPQFIFYVCEKSKTILKFNLERPNRDVSVLGKSSFDGVENNLGARRYYYFSLRGVNLEDRGHG